MPFGGTHSPYGYSPPVGNENNWNNGMTPKYQNTMIPFNEPLSPGRKTPTSVLGIEDSPPLQSSKELTSDNNGNGRMPLRKLTDIDQNTDNMINHGPQKQQLQQAQQAQQPSHQQPSAQLKLNLAQNSSSPAQQPLQHQSFKQPKYSNNAFYTNSYSNQHVSPPTSSDANASFGNNGGYSPTINTGAPVGMSQRKRKNFAELPTYGPAVKYRRYLPPAQLLYQSRFPTQQQPMPMTSKPAGGNYSPPSNTASVYGPDVPQKRSKGSINVSHEKENYDKYLFERSGSGSNLNDVNNNCNVPTGGGNNNSSNMSTNNGNSGNSKIIFSQHSPPSPSSATNTNTEVNKDDKMITEMLATDPILNQSYMITTKENQFDSTQMRLFTQLNNKHRSKTTCCSFTRDGQLLASGGHEQNILIWMVNSSELTAVYDGHSYYVLDLAFSKTEGTNILASASKDSTIRVWNVSSGEGIVLGRLPDNIYPTSIDFHPVKTDVLVTSDSEGFLRFWNTTQNIETLSVPVKAELFLHRIYFIFVF
eukprot:TRINITY_DN8890_c0_g3_i1.p1 TRINITY_DN8890_c0_g3~~TRINITY_DN8890_c0_g3_i1.p1  ORF type:complete len:532 (+),score=101.11 TRINITY_DN8890_c0_g3_i1:1098-2693(+)